MIANTKIELKQYSAVVSDWWDRARAEVSKVAFPISLSVHKPRRHSVDKSR
jgi:hypothetical protein